VFIIYLHLSTFKNLHRRRFIHYGAHDKDRISTEYLDDNVFWTSDLDVRGRLSSASSIVHSCQLLMTELFWLLLPVSGINLPCPAASAPSLQVFCNTTIPFLPLSSACKVTSSLSDTLIVFVTYLLIYHY